MVHEVDFCGSFYVYIKEGREEGKREEEKRQERIKKESAAADSVQSGSADT